MIRAGPSLRGLLLLGFLGASMLGVWQLSEAFRKNSYQAWIAQSEDSAQFLSGTLLNWLEESYAPLSGLAALAEHSPDLTDEAFLNAYDGLEARATTFFLDGAAYLRPQEDGRWQIVYTTNPYGSLRQGEMEGDAAWLRDTIAESVARSGDLILGPPAVIENRVHSAVALRLETPAGAAVVVGIVDITALIEGLYRIHVLPGMQLELEGKFLDRRHQPVWVAQAAQTLHTVTDRTVSAGADLRISWLISRDFAGGPPEGLARVTLIGGLVATILAAMFVAALLWRNQTINDRVRAATAELASSQERFELAMETARLAIYDYHPQTGELIVDDRWVAMPGYPETVLGGHQQAFGRLIDAEDERRGLSVFQEHADGQAPLVRTEFASVDHDGTSHHILNVGRIVERDEEGAPLRFIGMHMDITEQKLAEGELKASMERFRVLFEQSSDAHLIFGDEGIIDCNDAASRMLRYDSREDLLASHPAAFSPEVQPDGQRSEEKSMEMDAIARRDGYHRFEWTHRRKDGEDFLVEVTLTPVELAGETVLLAVWHDLTERKLVEDALRAAKEAADAANQAKSAFLANMSHELRTPMNAILGYSEMLMDEAEDLGQGEFMADLKRINQAGTQLLALINDVLDLSKIESGKVEVFPEEIDLDRLIDELSATAGPLVEKRGNQLVIERGEHLGGAYQDLTRIRQTVLNLLSNAAKFTEAGVVTLGVHRETRQGEDWLRFSVADTGIGVAADKLEHIFKEFTQADDSTTRDYGGTGLGLSISQRFSHLLGGELVVESEVGKGSTFAMLIPASLPGHALPHVVEQDRAALAAVRQHAGGAGHTVLIIDDDPEACDIIGRYLHKDGFATVTAGSGEQGLTLAHQVKPAAITLDVMMPDMDGWATLRALKADPELASIPVIMLSMIDDRTRGYSLGAVDYLTKPIDREQLLAALHHYQAGENAKRALIVEDDADTRRLMTQHLERAGWSITSAGNGAEALAVMDTQTPDLVVLDLMMPVMDGFDFLASMRAREAWQSIPVVVVTAKSLTSEDRDRLRSGADRILRKNAYTPQQLLEQVREAVDQRSEDESDPTPQPHRRRQP